MQLRRKWSGWNQLTLSAHVGLNSCQARINQPVQNHLRITELNTLSNSLDPVAEITSGNSLKLGLSSQYLLTER